MKSRKMRLDGRVACMGEARKKIYMSLMGKAEVKKN
jgi:hypothetical protein